MQGQVNAAVGNGCLCQRHEVRRLGVLPRACGDLQDDGGLNLTCCLGDRLHDLHVVDVEGADGVTAGIRLFEHLGSCDKSHICFFLSCPGIYPGRSLAGTSENTSHGESAEFFRHAVTEFFADRELCARILLRLMKNLHAAR